MNAEKQERVFQLVAMLKCADSNIKNWIEQLQRAKDNVINLEVDAMAERKNIKDYGKFIEDKKMEVENAKKELEDMQ